MKKILVPCDFSDPAIQAFKFAAEIAAQSKGKIFLLHVVEVPVMHETVLMPTLYFEKELMDESKAMAEKRFASMKAEWITDGQLVETHTILGTTTATILDFISIKKIDLVVMGTYGAKGAKEFFIGSNTEKIVRKAFVPVISIKRAQKFSAIKNIVFVNELDMKAEDLTLKVKELQGLFKAMLHLLYVNTPAAFRRDEVTKQLAKDFAKRFMLRNYTFNICNDLDQESGIRAFRKSIKADMVVMATHGRKGLSHLFYGSIAEDIVNHLDCPIWTFQTAKKK